MSILNFRRKDEDWSSTTSRVNFAVGDQGEVDDRGPLGLNLLHCPSEPQIEVIFVHGLGGGSKKTWSKTKSAHHYWPREWIPKDPAFERVRVHSYGYNTDWKKGKDNCLNIHHIGKLFLGELNTAPCLIDSKTPFVFIGHSLGGLVIKKALVLARQGVEYQKLSERFHTVYFLATPHRGSDSANLLKNILQLANSSRGYVADLVKGSTSLQAINEEFRNNSEHLKLWSFYETQKLKIGIHSTLIVDPDSATLDYRDETQMPMNADHRSICKFDDPADPNYIILRNSLESTIRSIQTPDLKEKAADWQSEVQNLKSFLDVSDEPDDDLALVEDARMPGTCEWLLTKDYFKKWNNNAGERLNVLRIIGKPAIGKSVLAGYVINQLQISEKNCSYFFFKYGDRKKSQLGFCLRSLAFQMGRTNGELRAKMLELHESGMTLEMDNERDIWRKIFVSCIFQKRVSTQYWVIDGLDECMDNGSYFPRLLARLDLFMPLQIFITSRENNELEKSFLTLPIHHIQLDKISSTDTLIDIESVISERSKAVLSKSGDYRNGLIERLLEKSEGSFLWAVLVLQELANCHSEKDMDQILEEIPRDMDPFYSRILEFMTASSGRNRLAKAILTWVACAFRPLTIRELEGALMLDLDDAFPNLKESIRTLCGSLVTVDKFDKVKMVHTTAREFLFGKDLDSYFAIDKMEAHTQMVRACLKYLNSDEMKPPRTGRKGSARRATEKRRPFSAYACVAFSYHLSRASPLASDVLALTEGFLKLNVLSWIELIAQTKHLVPLIYAAKNLKKYFNLCTVERSPLGRSMHIMREWSTDMTRIAAKYANALVASPSAIYALIPPLCPAESMISKVVLPGRKMSVVGISNMSWDNRLLCIDYRNGQTSALCYGEEYMAVGCSTGAITLYNVRSCQEYTNLHQGEAVRFLQFKNGSSLLASGGMKTIWIWDAASRENIFQLGGTRRLMALFFDGTLFGAASSDGCLTTWDLDDQGAQQPDRLLVDESRTERHQRPPMPSAISIAMAHNMLAIAYTGQPITLWDLEDNVYYGACGKKLSSGSTSTHAITALLFNPNPNIGLLVASYLDGDLALLDPFDDLEMRRLRANCHTLSASPNGRLLAGGAGGGYIHIYEFESLDLLYRVASSNLFIKRLAFSEDNLHFADIRGSHCNVWELADLSQGSVGDGSSQATSTTVIDITESDPTIKITAILPHPNNAFAFCGRENGSVTLYDLTNGAEIRRLYSHKAAVHILAWWPKRNILTSVDLSNRICTWSLKADKAGGWVVEDMVFESRLDCGHSLRQLSICDEMGKFIIATRESDHLWNIHGEQEDKRKIIDDSSNRRWMQHPHSPNHVVCIGGAILHARVYAWGDWSEVKSISLGAAALGLQVKNNIFTMSGRETLILLEMSQLDGSPQKNDLHLFSATVLHVQKDTSSTRDTEPASSRGIAQPDSSLENNTTAMKDLKLAPSLNKQLKLLSQVVRQVIGIAENKRLIFLDTHSWVCSADLGMLDNSSQSYQRHFFVPYEWFAGTREVLCAVAKQDVVFVRNDGLAVVKGGLEYIEPMGL